MKAMRLPILVYFSSVITCYRNHVIGDVFHSGDDTKNEESILKIRDLSNNIKKTEDENISRDASSLNLNISKYSDTLIKSGNSTTDGIQVPSFTTEINAESHRIHDYIDELINSIRNQNFSQSNLDFNLIFMIMKKKKSTLNLTNNSQEINESSSSRRFNLKRSLRNIKDNDITTNYNSDTNFKNKKSSFNGKKQRKKSCRRFGCCCSYDDNVIPCNCCSCESNCFPCNGDKNNDTTDDGDCCGSGFVGGCYPANGGESPAGVCPCNCGVCPCCGFVNNCCYGNVMSVSSCKMGCPRISSGGGFNPKRQRPMGMGMFGGFEREGPFGGGMGFSGSIRGCGGVGSRGGMFGTGRGMKGGPCGTTNKRCGPCCFGRGNLGCQYSGLL